MKIGNVESIKSNCLEYVRARNGLDVLRYANGSNNYKDIAKLLSIHPTTVSSLLSKAKDFGLATRLATGNYKKVAGIMGYMPKIKQKKDNSSKTISDVIQKISKTKTSIKRRSIQFTFPIQKQLLIQVEKMSEAYKSLYAVENVLRELIRSVLSTQVDWWKNNVSKDIQDKVTIAIQDLPYHAVKRKDELEYTHLGQLKEIIVSKKNWKLFIGGLHTRDKNDFSATINKAISSRNAIGHCIPLKPEDLKVVELRFNDILKMIK